MSSSPVRRHFASSYREARAGFLDAVRRRGLAAESHVHPVACGAQDEALAMDVALLGDPGAAAMLILTSGTHGVEGFCGSGFQRALVADDEMVGRLEKGRVAILLVHAVNPYGFSHLRRVNEDNVDLNRNFADFTASRSQNAAYAELHDLLLPREWPPTAANRADLAACEARMGSLAFRAAVVSGQGIRADGLFFSGHAPTWSNITLRGIVRRYGAAPKRIGWIDLHTGLGPFGHGEKIFAGANDIAELARARAWYGADVMSYYDGQSASVEVKGPAVSCIYEECPHAETTSMALEYGTFSLEAVLEAIRGDHWLAAHPEASADARAAIKRAVRDAFYVDSDDWKGMVLGQARTAVLQAVTALSAG